MQKKLFFVLSILFLIVLGVQSQELHHETHHEGERTKSQAKIGYWQIHNNNLDTFRIDVDTALHAVHNYNPIFRQSISNTFTGNLGAPYISNIYFDREEVDFLFSDVYRAYMKMAEDIPVINTRTPYSVLTYGNGGPKEYGEESLSILFSQNVTKDFNVGGYYDLIYGRGRYQNLSTRHRDYGLFSSYMSPKYNMFFNIGGNKLEGYENGGLADDIYVTAPLEVTDASGARQPENFPVQLSDGHSFYKKHFISLKQNYNIGVTREVEVLDSTAEDSLAIEFVSALKLVHKFDLSYDVKQYDGSASVGDYYDTAYIHSSTTLDSVHRRNISNEIGLYLDEGINRFGKFGAGAFIRMDNVSISNHAWAMYEDTTIDKGYFGRETQYEANVEAIAIADSLIEESLTRDLTEAEQAQVDSRDALVADNAGYASRGDLAKTYNGYNYTNVSVGGSIFKRTGTHFFFDADGKIVLSGYNLGDWQTKGMVKQVFPKWGKMEISGRANFERRTPDYFQNHYYANNFWWDNDFKPTFKQQLGGTFKLPKFHFELSADVDNMQNLVYYDQMGLPAQYDGNLAVLAIKLKKTFEVGRHIIWDNQVVYQETSASEALPLPQLSAYSNLALCGVLFKVLHFEIGADCRYHTAYYAPGYMPATGRFYNQQELMIGNYPYMNAYANFFLRRMRFFIMEQHVNFGWPSLDYFSAPHYAYNQRMLKVGLQWTFYD